MNNSVLKKKDTVVEYMRAIACLGVITIHVFKSARDNFLCELSNTQVFSYTAVVNNMRWCVPVFLMISGALLLNPQKQFSLKSLFKYTVRIVVVLSIAGTIFALMEMVFDNNDFSISMLWKSVLYMLMGRSWDHLWYLYLLLFLYCFVPALRAVASMLKIKEMFFTLLMLLLFSSVIPTLQALSVETGLNVYSVSVYFLYMLLGFWLYRGYIVIPKCLCVIFVITSAFGLIFLAWVSEVSGICVPTALTSHSSVFVIMQSVGMFGLLIHIRPIQNHEINRIIMSFAESSFGIYIIHMFIINILYKVISINPSKLGWFAIFVVFVITTIVSYCVVYIMRKFSVVRRFL